MSHNDRRSTHCGVAFNPIKNPVIWKGAINLSVRTLSSCLASRMVTNHTHTNIFAFSLHHTLWHAFFYPHILFYSCKNSYAVICKSQGGILLCMTVCSLPCVGGSHLPRENVRCPKIWKDCVLEPTSLRIVSYQRLSCLNSLSCQLLPPNFVILRMISQGQFVPRLNDLESTIMIMELEGLPWEMELNIGEINQGA